jgi:3-ketosteroid 9alpha-monooxygenase subunit B
MEWKRSLAATLRILFWRQPQEEGVDIPFGCTSGNCHMCLCQIIEGEVVRADLDSLNKKQREEGFILTCQSRPKSEVLKIEIKG